MLRRVRLLTFAFALAACETSSRAVPAPPPPPAPPIPRAVPDEAQKLAPEAARERTPATETTRHEHKTTSAQKASSSSKKPPMQHAAKTHDTPPKTPAAAKTTAEPTPKPQGAASATASPATDKPASKTTGAVRVPSTAHVRVEIPAGLQTQLDRDPRMQPWSNQVIAIIDRCYQNANSVSDVIEVLVTMHENDRPDADIKRLPPSLTPVVSCATGSLMRVKMPLFTGPEGSRHTVRIHFSP